MEQEQTIDRRLSVRKWILDHMWHVLDQSVYHRTHKENFKYPVYKVWDIGTDEGRLSLDEVKEYVD